MLPCSQSGAAAVCPCMARICARLALSQVCTLAAAFSVKLTLNEALHHTSDLALCMTRIWTRSLLTVAISAKHTLDEAAHHASSLCLCMTRICARLFLTDICITVVAVCPVLVNFDNAVPRGMSGQDPHKLSHAIELYTSDCCYFSTDYL